ncbi:MAG: class I SAM-dependent methyltransferase [Solirubrobacterales bacterium]
MAATVPALDTERIRDANIRYHDAAARGYDSKWAIDYGEIGARQVLGKLSKALGQRPARYERALEIGAGTGYFSLNLLQQGVIGSAVATDISPGMLERLDETARELGLDVETRQADAESLPFPDGSFDLVLGHAVLHHLPGLEQALSEFHRVLSPGGTLAFMGEPSAHGDRLAAMPKRLGALVEPAWRRMMRAAPTASAGSAAPAEETYGELEGLVDVHTFTPGALHGLVGDAGFTHVRVSGEELLANVYGWFLRRLESDVEATTVPYAWHRFAFSSYLALQWVDGRLLEPRLPASLFYNLLVSGRRPF